MCATCWKTKIHTSGFWRINIPHLNPEHCQRKSTIQANFIANREVALVLGTYCYIERATGTRLHRFSATTAADAGTAGGLDRCFRAVIRSINSVLPACVPAEPATDKFCHELMMRWNGWPASMGIC